MKKHLINSILLLISATTYSQNCLIEPTQRFAYTLPIASVVNADSANNWFVMKPESTFDYGAFLVSSFEIGTFPFYHSDIHDYSVYNLHLEPLHSIDFYNFFGAGVDTIFVWNDALQQEEYKVIQTGINTNEIKSFKFYEDWSYDSTKFSFDKKVVAIDAIRSYYRGEEYDNANLQTKNTFRIVNQDTETPEKLQEYRTVQYEFTFTPDSVGDVHPLFTKHSWNTLIHSLIDKVTTGKEQAYDFITKKPLSIESAERLLGHRFDTLETYNAETGESEFYVIEKTFDPTEIKSILFSEIWHIDKTTGMLYKTVTGITLVRHINVYNHELEKYVTKKIPIFYVTFN